MVPNNWRFKAWLKAALFCLLAGALPLRAELFQVEAPATGVAVEDQQAAFDLLLLRLTGDPATRSLPVIAKARGNISPFVQQFSYSDDSISVRFNSQMVGQLLTQAEVRQLGQHRPAVLMWYAVEQGFNRSLLSEAQQAEMMAELNEQTAELALSLQWPILDLQDTAIVDVNDVWGSFDRNIYQASERYSSPLIMTVKQFPVSDGSLQLQWRLLDAQARTQLASGQAQGDSQVAADQLSSQLLQAMVERYGVVLNEASGESVLLSFSGLRSLNRMVSLESYLNQQPAVARVQLHSLQGETVTYRVELLSPWQDLQTALSVDEQFEVDQENPSQYLLR